MQIRFTTQGQNLVESVVPAAPMLNFFLDLMRSLPVASIYFVV